MPLGQHQEAKAKAWLADHFRGCLNCSSRDVRYGEIVSASTYSAHPFAIGRPSPSTPMLEVVCNSCAFTHLFDCGPMNLP